MKSGIWVLRLALLLLFLGVLFGFLASFAYRLSDAKSDFIGFLKLRPLHVTSAYFGIVLGGLACVALAIQRDAVQRSATRLLKVHLLLWLVALVGIFYSYLTGDFGGREYWEFKPIWALPILLSYFVFLVYFLKNVGSYKSWPVYYWMWFTGIVFFAFIFIENYLWLFPYFREHLIADMTIQWKVNGSIVGAVNQIIYGLAFYLMTKISGNEKMGHSKLIFAMYFLGLFNLMFNWGHHIYILPTDRYIHHISYIVSMTEWVILIRIFYNWNQQLNENRTHYYFFPYRFLMAADYWVIINLAIALLMSIPAFNLYTHGTQITVAHAMGTTIGINTMIVLGGAFYFIKPTFESGKALMRMTLVFWTTQIALLLFLITLAGMGIQRALWQAGISGAAFGQMMLKSRPWMIGFIITGTLLFVSLASVVLYLLFHSFKTKATYQLHRKV
ncbi:cbb3-type cytochrome c oxidase subunit I [Flavobacterium orientale]|nr:cbb3-type cytochrome c oxidase subunit I [Flavobacterium orientale]